MLGKLMKYELKATGRIMLPLLAALIAAGGALALDIRITDSMPSNPILTTVFFTILFAAAVIALAVVTVMMIFQRFFRNLLGDEGYLMFTLPVTTAQNIAAKGLTAMIWVISGIVSGILTGFLMVAILGGIRQFTEIMGDAVEELIRLLGITQNRQVFTLFILIFLTGIAGSIMKVYAAMSVGHLVNGHKVLASVGAYICFSVIESFLMNIFAALGFGDWLVRLNESSSVPIAVLIVMIVIELIQAAAYAAVTWYVLSRRLNLE